MIIGILVAVGVLICDQLTKYAIMNYVLDNQLILEISSFFNLVYAWNTGVSFSMFNDSGTIGTILFCGLSHRHCSAVVDV